MTSESTTSPRSRPTGRASAAAGVDVGSLTPALVADLPAAVRAAVAGGQPVAAVTRSFGVSRPTIYKALDTTKAGQP